jgi:hypothetical protein
MALRGVSGVEVPRVGRATAEQCQRSARTAVVWRRWAYLPVARTNEADGVAVSSEMRCGGQHKEDQGSVVEGGRRTRLPARAGGGWEGMGGVEVRARGRRLVSWRLAGWLAGWERMGTGQQSLVYDPRGSRQSICAGPRTLLLTAVFSAGVAFDATGRSDELMVILPATVTTTYLLRLLLYLLPPCVPNLHDLPPPHVISSPDLDGQPLAANHWRTLPMTHVERPGHLLHPLLLSSLLAPRPSTHPLKRDHKSS